MFVYSTLFSPDSGGSEFSFYTVNKSSSFHTANDLRFIETISSRKVNDKYTVDMGKIFVFDDDFDISEFIRGDPSRILEFKDLKSTDKCFMIDESGCMKIRWNMNELLNDNVIDIILQVIINNPGLVKSILITSVKNKVIDELKVMAFSVKLIDLIYKKSLDKSMYFEINCYYDEGLFGVVDNKKFDKLLNYISNFNKRYLAIKYINDELFVNRDIYKTLTSLSIDGLLNKLNILKISRDYSFASDIVEISWNNDSVFVKCKLGYIESVCEFLKQFGHREITFELNDCYSDKNLENIAQNLRYIGQLGNEFKVLCVDGYVDPSGMTCMTYTLGFWKSILEVFDKLNCNCFIGSSDWFLESKNGLLNLKSCLDSIDYIDGFFKLIDNSKYKLSIVDTSANADNIELVKCLLRYRNYRYTNSALSICVNIDEYEDFENVIVVRDSYVDIIKFKDHVKILSFIDNCMFKFNCDLQDEEYLKEYFVYKIGNCTYVSKSIDGLLNLFNNFIYIFNGVVSAQVDDDILFRLFKIKSLINNIKGPNIECLVKYYSDQVLITKFLFRSADNFLHRVNSGNICGYSDNIKIDKDDIDSVFTDLDMPPSIKLDNSLSDVSVILNKKLSKKFNEKTTFDTDDNILSDSEDEFTDVRHVLYELDMSDREQSNLVCTKNYKSFVVFVVSLCVLMLVLILKDEYNFDDQIKDVCPQVDAVNLVEDDEWISGMANMEA